jgi:hypothetical protein
MENRLSRCQHTRKYELFHAIERFESLRKEKWIAKTHYQTERRRPRKQRNALEDGELGERWFGLMRLAQDLEQRFVCALRSIDGLSKLCAHVRREHKRCPHALRRKGVERRREEAWLSRSGELIRR